MLNATTDDQGVIVISQSQNTDIYNIVDNNFELVSDMEISEDIDTDD